MPSNFIRPPLPPGRPGPGHVPFVLVPSAPRPQPKIPVTSVNGIPPDENGDVDVSIPDIEAIRAGAAKGATAYQRPETGVPKSDLAADVQTSLGKADTALQEHQSLAAYVNAASYDPEYGDPAKPAILLKHGDTVVAAVDASAFVIDGMVSTVAVTGGNLVITFNTDAGKQDISIPLTSFFNPSNYYDKTAADARFATKADATMNLRGSNHDGFSDWYVTPVYPSGYTSYTGPTWVDEHTVWVITFTGHPDAPDVSEVAAGRPGRDSLSLEFSGGTTATRTVLKGYMLGDQYTRPLASEAEAEALRQGKLDKTGGIVTGPVLINSARAAFSPLTLGFNADPQHVENTVDILRASNGDIYLRIHDTTLADAVLQKLPRTSGTFALTAGAGHEGNLAALDAQGNPTNSGKSFEDIQAQIDTESPLLARSFAVPQQSGWTVNQGAASSPIYFRPRFFGMKDGDLFKGIVLRTRSTGRTSFPSGVYMRLKRYSDGQVLGVSELTVWPDTASTDVVFRFPRAVELTSSGNYYTLDFSETPTGNAVNFGMSLYSLPSGSTNPDFYFASSTNVPLATAQFYSWEELTGADIPVSGTDATKISAALAGKATMADATLTERGDPSTPGFSAWELDYSDASTQGPIDRIAWSGSIWTAALQRVCGPSKGDLASYTTVTWAPGGWGDGTTPELVGTWTGDHWEPSITEYDGHPLVIFGSRSEATPAQEMIGGVAGTGAFDPNALELRINVDNTWPDSGGSGTVVATRTALPGYQLGSDTNHILASEAEAEALRTAVAGKMPSTATGADIKMQAVGNTTVKTAVDNRLMSSFVAPAFKTGQAYTAGTKVVYGSEVYEFTQDKAAGNWNANIVRRLIIDDLLADFFAQYYPEGNVKSAAEFTAGIKYDDPDTVNRTITVKPFCNTGDSDNDNSGLVGRVVIPPFVDASGNPYISDDGTRYKVVGVGSGTDSNNSNENLTSVIAPSTVANIEDKAFHRCTKLTSVSAQAATSIGSGAFNTCSSLVSVSLPAAASIVSWAFVNCTSLKSISLSAATSIGDNAFRNCTSLKSVSLPAATSIKGNAFNSCYLLVSVSLPVAVNIKGNAFNGCYSLASVSLPAATSIEDYAFVGCTSLESIDFGATLSSVPTLGSNVFNNVPTTCKIIVPDSQYDTWTAATIPDPDNEGETLPNPWYDLVTDGYKFLRHSIATSDYDYSGTGNSIPLATNALPDPATAITTGTRSVFTAPCKGVLYLTLQGTTDTNSTHSSNIAIRVWPQGQSSAAFGLAYTMLYNGQRYALPVLLNANDKVVFALSNNGLNNASAAFVPMT